MNFCTSSGLSGLGTSLGLSQTTGYTPYLPVLALSIAAKWLHICQINPYMHFVTDDWFVISAALLTILDLVIDLVPAVSTGWHAIHTAVTPIVGGFVAAATTTPLSGVTLHVTSLPGVASPITVISALHLDVAGVGSTSLMFVIGFIIAGLVHLHRFGGRAAANVGHVFTFGISNIVISIAEDILAVISTIISFLAPALMLIIVILVLLFIILTFRYIRRGFRFLRSMRQQRDLPAR